MSDNQGRPDAGEGGSRGKARLSLSRLVENAIPVLRRAAPGLMGAALRERCNTSDLVQSALVEALSSLPSFRGRDDSEFVGWALRIMERNAIDRRRRLNTKKRRIDREVPDDGLTLQHLTASEGSPSKAAIDREELLLIAQALTTLPVDQQRILQIIALRGGSHAEAARVLERSEGACRVLLSRARAALLVAMAREGDDVDG
ncbi:MAG: sigma-70 family RNA polymerase sigma factor [Planctomycetota bacterium]